MTLDINEDHASAVFSNPNLPAICGKAPTASMLEAALSLPSGAIDNASFAPERLSAGAIFVYARASMEHVRRARLDSAAFSAMGLDETVGIYLYAEGGETSGACYHARMFAPDAGIPEDPATGSAAAALPGHIVNGSNLADGGHHWIVEQGFEMGRPSIINVFVTTKAGAIEAVRIGGNAVHVQRGQLFV